MRLEALRHPGNVPPRTSHVVHHKLRCWRNDAASPSPQGGIGVPPHTDGQWPLKRQIVLTLSLTYGGAVLVCAGTHIDQHNRRLFDVLVSPSLWIDTAAWALPRAIFGATAYCVGCLVIWAAMGAPRD